MNRAAQQKEVVDIGGTEITSVKQQRKYQLHAEETFQEDGNYADVTANPRLLSILSIYDFEDAIFFDPAEGKPRELQVYTEVQRLSDVDNLTSTFTAKLWIRMGWAISKELVRSILQAQATTINTGPVLFQPWKMFTFFNASEVTEIAQWTNPMLCYWGELDNDVGKFHLVTNATFEVVFQEVFELENFPVDCQDLTMSMGLTFNKYHTTTQSIIITPFNNSGHSCMIVRDGIQETDFSFRNIIYECLQTDPSAEMGQQYNVISIRIKIQRKWQNYFFRICLILSIVTLCGCAGFSMDLSDDYPDACAYMSTILLTVVAFLFVVSSTLPAIPYLTFLDWFVYALLAFAALQIACLMPFSPTLDQWSGNEKTVLIINVSIWAGIHLTFFVLAIWKTSVEKKKLPMNGKELCEFFGKKKKQNQRVKWEDTFTTEKHKYFAS